MSEGEKYRGDKSGKREFGCSEAACDLEMQVDLSGKLMVPLEIVCSRLRPEIVLWSVSQKIVYFTGTVPWEDSVEEGHERKKLRYPDLEAEAEL